jgi:hypothetical protein
MSDLVKLLNDLGQDAELAQLYSQDRDAVLSQYDLGDDALAALRAGDVDAVRKASGLDNVHMTHGTIKCY